MKIAIATWDWGTLGGLLPEPGWTAPKGAVPGPDLRAVQDCELAAEYGDFPWSLFVFEDAAKQPADAYLLGDGRMDEIRPDSKARQRWRECFGRLPEGDTAADWLWWQLTDGADGTGDTPCMPLIPTHFGILELFVQGHSLIRSEPFGEFSKAKKHHQEIQRFLQREMKELKDFGPPGLAAKVMTVHLRKYRGMKATDLDEDVKPQKPSTDISDNFNRTNETLTSGPWTDSGGGFEVSSNQCRKGGSVANHYAAHTTALSSADMYSQVLHVVGAYAGAAVRVVTSGSPRNYCFYNNNTGGWFLQKQSGTGSTTIEWSNIGDYRTQTFKLEVDGNTLTGYTNGTQRTQQTDSTYATGNYAGLYAYANASYLDDFAAGDLVAATGNPWYAYSQQ